MAKYDSFQHRRRSIRLRDWDYRSPGYYFVTICTYQRQHLFNDASFMDIVANALQQVPKQKHAQHVALDEWSVLPNHAHVVLEFTAYPPGFDATVTQPSGELRNALAGSLGVVIGQYKTNVTIPINNLRHTPGHKVWQRGYYEHIIRNERELNAIRQYIHDNPARWLEDRDNLDALISKMTYRGY